MRIFTTFIIINTAHAFRIPIRKIPIEWTHSMVSENDADTIITTCIIEHAVKKKIFTEVANDSDILQTFDTFKLISIADEFKVSASLENLNSLYIVVLIVSSIYSSNIKYNNKIEKLQKTNPKPIYRWLDFTMLVIVITLMKNVKNAI